MFRLYFVLGALLLSANTFADTFQDQPSPWTIQFSGKAQHFKKSRNPYHKWNENNWGVGIQYEQRRSDSPWTRGYSVGTLKDSYDAGGGYAAISETREFARVGTLKAEAGAGLFALWRTMAWEGKHKLMIAPLPVMHIEETKSGIGANLVLAPAVSKQPGFIFLQLTARF